MRKAKLGYRRRRGSKSPLVKRVNASLDAETARKLDELMRARKLSVSEVLTQAIDGLHRAFPRELRPSSYEVALEVGFIGCGDGPEDLSTNSKRYIDEYLAKKYPQHFPIVPDAGEL